MAHGSPTVKRVPGKQAGQRHMKKKAKKGTAKSTMGMGKVKPKARGAMGKNQQTGDGEAF
jgi:hypothetical protein